MHPAWECHLDKKDREYVYLPRNGWKWMPKTAYLGKRVDKIHYSLAELAQTDKELENDAKEIAELNSNRQSSQKYPFLRSAFVQFNSQIAAHMACQTLISPNPLESTVQIVDVTVEDIRWDCLFYLWWSRWLHTAVVWAVVAILLLVWAILVALTGILSQVTTLAESTPWLFWIGRTPLWFRGYYKVCCPN